MTFNLVVVGASFAGLATARAAALAGHSVLVIDKKSSAGAKLHSTGIIVKDAVESLPWLQQVPADLTRRIEGVRLHAPNLQYVDLHAPGYYFWATDTPALLDWMVQSVRELGVQFQFNTVFESADARTDGWTLRLKDLPEVQTRYLIGADGPHSRVATALGLSKNTQFLYGVEHEYAHSPLDANLLHCFIDRQLAPGYIGWALAGVKASQVGLARRISAPGVQDNSRKVDLQAFVRKIDPDAALSRQTPLAIRAGMIPCGGVLRRVACARALLVGDAAGMVSPVTAGGIHTALRHGQAAGQAVAQYLQGQQADPAWHLPQSYPGFRAKRALRWAFDHFQSDWAFNLMLKTRSMRRAAELIYFHRRGA